MEKRRNHQKCAKIMTRMLCRIQTLLAAWTVLSIFFTRTSAFSTATFEKNHRSCRRSALWVATNPEALEKTASHLKKLEQIAQSGDESRDFEAYYRNYVQQPANSLKILLKKRNLPGKGRKPDLAKRLAEYDIQEKTGRFGNDDQVEEDAAPSSVTTTTLDGKQIQQLATFCGISLSKAGGLALGKANFKNPTPIQKAAIPALVQGESVILHAETGSGKTLAYLLPITEQLWTEHNEQTDGDGGYGIILTPTRELAAQVAGIAVALAPPGTVRLVSHATNLMSDGLKDRGEMENGGRLDTGDGRTSPRLFIGSAKAIMHSLYGDGKMPASPTRKPDAMYLLKNVRWVVLDEVDRCLNIRKKHGGTPKHEKPTAVVTSAVARLTLGRAQVVSASATVGRSLKRELSRILGLPPKEWPRVVRGSNNRDDEEFLAEKSRSNQGEGHIGRAVTIPDTVEHYLTPVDTSSVGKLLTDAFFVLKNLNQKKGRRILLVLSRNCGINTQQAIGALKHFRCEPEPTSLLDALEAQGTDRMIEKHRQVSGATGVGESYFTENQDEEQEGKGYLLVTGEDTVRGLHLDGLDVVVVVGSALGPDEYTHIAGRTGRAGRQGKVINVLSHKQSATVSGWEKMLDIEFKRLDVQDVLDLE